MELSCDQNVAIVTARGNNASIRDKNLLMVGNQPLVSYPIRAAAEAKLIGCVYVSTDCPCIAEVAQGMGCQIIWRPEQLCTPDSHHGDTILHALAHIRGQLPELSVATVLLGNTVMVNAELIDLSVELLSVNPELDSAMSVWQAQDDHPFRALTGGGDGYLKSYLDITCGTSRQEYPPVFFYDQGVWTFRADRAEERSGPNPWWWMGKKVFPIVRQWVTGRDIHSPLDVQVAQLWHENALGNQITNRAEIEQALRGKSQGESRR